MRAGFIVVLALFMMHAAMRADALEHTEPALNGRIAAVTVERYAVSERDQVWLRGETRTITLVPLGGPLPPGMEPLQAQGVLTEAVTTHFAPNGEPLLVVRRNGLGVISARIEYFYDELDRCVEIRESHGTDEWSIRTLRQYDEQGRLTGLWKEEASGEVVEERRMQYDAEGRLSEEVRGIRGEAGAETLRYHHLEELGKVVIEHYTEEGQYAMSRERLYDEQERMVMELYADREGEPSGFLRRRYDEQGRLLETRFVRQGEVEYRSVYRYAQHESPVEIERSNRRGVIEWKTIAYEFDEWGNWIRRASYERSMRRGRSEVTPVTLETRVIEYAEAATIEEE